MKSIFHITFAPITDYLGQGLQLEASAEAGFNVKVINVSALFNFEQPVHSERFKNMIVVVNSFEELKKYISGFSPESTILSTQIMFEWRFRKLFRMIATMNQYPWCVFLLGQLPFHSNITFLQKLAHGNLSKLPGRLVLRLISTILFKLKYFKNQDIIFYAGENLKPAFSKLHFPINYFDYDSYLQSPEVIDEGYIVFLDESLFQHPDDAIVGNNIGENSVKNYRQSITAYFDFLERSTGLKVVIAAHPKSNYNHDFFDKRKVIKFATNELVKKASLVVCHCSTSLGYAVCYEKPLLFLTCNEIIKFSKTNQTIDQYITNLARHVERPVINIDRPFTELTPELRSINKRSYEKFKMGYLTTNQTKNIQTRHVIANYLNSILSQHTNSSNS